MDCVVAPVDQRNVDPLDAVSWTLPPAQNVVEPFAVIVAVGAATAFTFALLLLAQAPFVTVTLKLTVPADAAVKEMAFVLGLPEIAPFEIVQAYVAPAVDGTLALPLLPAHIDAGAVIVAGAGELTITFALLLLLQPPNVTVTAI